MEALLEAGYDFIEGPRAVRSSDRIFCTHDGNTVLHPPCYGNDDAGIVDRCTEYFTGQREQPDWMQRQQAAAVERWDHAHRHLDLSRREDGLALQPFFDLFDAFFFCAPGTALTSRVDLHWTPFNPRSPPCQTHELPSADPRRPRARIAVQRSDPACPFTRDSAQRILGALLHAMAHALIICRGCDCNTCCCRVTRCRTVGVTGHGPLWVRLCGAMQAQAERRFGGLRCGGWDLDCGAEGAPVVRERRARERFERRALVGMELGRRAGRVGS